MYSDISIRVIACSSSNRKCRQGAGQLGFADAGRPKEHERADGPIRVLQARTSAPYRCRNSAYGFRLPDDSLAKLVLHAKQLVFFAFEHLLDRNARPA